MAFSRVNCKCTDSVIIYINTVCREQNLIVKEIIGLSVGEVVLPVLVGVIFHGTKPYSLIVALFAMAVVIFALHFYIDHLITVRPSSRKDGATAASEPLLLDDESS